MNTANPENSPTPEAWTQLYEQATRFQELAPWGWMNDADLFGVQDPQTGQIGYGCILGMLGECFGLVLYSGSKGLEGYYRARDGVESIRPDDWLHHKDCILLSFDMPSALEKPERDLFRQLGIKPARSKRIAVFRSYRPGYFPWPLTSEEVYHTTVCLEQAMDVALRLKTNPMLLEPPQSNQYLVRIRRENGNWQDEWHEAVPIHEITVFKKSIDAGRLENIRTYSLRQKMKWEIDFFHAPTPVRENGLRPYFPTLTLFVDHDSNFIFHSHLCAPDHQLVELHEQFLQALETSQILPAHVQVSKAELGSCIKPLTDLLGIKIQIVEKLPAMNAARDSMSEFFRSSRSK